MVVGEERWVFFRAVGDALGVHAAYLGAGCGGRVRRFYAVGSRVVGAGACKAMRQQS